MTDVRSEIFGLAVKVNGSWDDLASDVWLEKMPPRLFALIRFIPPHMLGGLGICFPFFQLGGARWVGELLSIVNEYETPCDLVARGSPKDKVAAIVLTRMADAAALNYRKVFRNPN